MISTAADNFNDICFY